MKLSTADRQILVTIRFAITLFLDYNDSCYRRGEPYVVPPSSLSHMTLIALSQRLEQILSRDENNADGGGNLDPPVLP